MDRFRSRSTKNNKTKSCNSSECLNIVDACAHIRLTAWLLTHFLSSEFTELHSVPSAVYIQVIFSFVASNHVKYRWIGFSVYFSLNALLRKVSSWDTLIILSCIIDGRCENISFWLRLNNRQMIDSISDSSQCYQVCLSRMKKQTQKMF